MQTLIYVFSGTGNSLLIANSIAKKLPQSKVIPLVDLLKTSLSPKLEDVNIGLIFPVYFYKMPAIVKRVLEENLLPKSKSIFCITSSGEETPNVIYDVNKLLGKNGSSLAFGKSLSLADNSIILKTSLVQRNKALYELDLKIDEIVQHIKNMDHIPLVAPNLWHLTLGPLTKFSFIHLYSAQNRYVDSRCINCNLCTRLCPVENIRNIDGKISIGQNCEWCFACLNWCPTQAIHFGKIHPNKTQQYHAPGIHSSQLSHRK
jgi:Pyruvate/2-oxoacid:ferredoxin oxidoreductase delta subunit